MVARRVFPYFLLSTALYGLVVVFFSNIITKSLKDLLLILFVMIGVFFVSKLSHSKMYVLMALLGLGFLSAYSLTNGNSTINLVLGLKITVLPMGMLFVGEWMQRRNVKIDRTLLVIYLLLIGAWTVQHSLGVDKLTSIGFVYGENIKLFYDGTPRYSSITMSPDFYAFFLAIVGVVLARTDMMRSRLFLSVAVRVCTFAFLYLATIRSALLFWLICEFVLYLTSYVRWRHHNMARAYVGLTLMLIPVVAYAVMHISFADSTLASTESLDMRKDLWSSTENTSMLSHDGLYGRGIGVVGAASRTTAKMGEKSANFAVDNQYLALFQQVGLIGIGLIAFILFVVLYRSFITKKHRSMTVALIAATLVSCYFTNVLEQYPFNLFLWMMLGRALGGEKSSKELVHGTT